MWISESSHGLLIRQIGTTMLGNYLAVSAKDNMSLPHDPQIPLLNKYPREISVDVQK